MINILLFHSSQLFYQFKNAKYNISYCCKIAWIFQLSELVFLSDILQKQSEIAIIASKKTGLWPICLCFSSNLWTKEAI